MQYTQCGRTPLMEASHKGNVAIVRMLIDAKADIDAKNEVNCSYETLHNAYSHSCVSYKL